MSKNGTYGNHGFLALYVFTIFLSAALLFWSELMIAKLLLPLFGGSPAVWNICMVFFQITLLLGYAYAHWSTRFLGVRRQIWLHSVLILLPLLTLPLVIPSWSGVTDGSAPMLNLIATLFVCLGATFFILSTSGPLLQRWFAASLHPHAAQPYFLYAASNLASFAVLISYPFIIEPAMSLQTQTKVWSIGYGVFVFCILLCVLALYTFGNKKPERIKTVESTKAERAVWAQRGKWVFYAAIPSSLMLGVTTYITTDVASMPLLWMIPLAIYLFSFVVAFAVKKPLDLTQKLLPYIGSALFVGVTLTLLSLGLPAAFTAIMYLIVFGLIAVGAHSALAGRRPSTNRLTEFYLWLAVGGVVGGVFNSLVSPVVFNDLYELPLVLFASLVLFANSKTIRMLQKRQLAFAILPVIVMLLLFVIFHTVEFRMSLEAAAAILAFLISGAFLFAKYQQTAFAIGVAPLMLVPVIVMVTETSLMKDRTFYGVIKVAETDSERSLTHGFTKHGSQYIDAQQSQKPTTYYHNEGPVGDIFKLCQEVDSCNNVGVIGLGAGTVAAYGRPGDTVTFYEIDPSVADIAADSRYFTYLSQSKAQTKVVLGDGRLTLNEDSNTYDLLVVDAFSSDAIPVHLLTKEAVHLYRSKLSKNGLIAVHISNRHLNLEPVMNAIAAEDGIQGFIRNDDGSSEDASHYASSWVLLAESASAAQILEQPGWRTLQGRDIRIWTDDYTNILDVLL